MENNQVPEPIINELKMPDNPITNINSDEHMSCEGEFKKPIQDNSFIEPAKEGIPRILIGIPILSYSHDFVESFLKFWTQICTMREKNMQVGFKFIYRKPVHLAEIELVEWALFNKCTHILFMDDDIYDITLEDLKKLVDADKEVIGGVMYASKFPHAMCVFRRYDKDKKVIDMPTDTSMFRLYEIPCNCNNCGFGLSHWDVRFCPVCGEEQDNLIQKADLIPFAFTLMKTSIFGKIKKPWFHCTDDYPTDSWFADRCGEANIQMYAHMGVRLNHNGINDATRNMYFQIGLEKNRRADKGLVNLNTEEMKKHEFLLYNKMQEAELKQKEKDKPILV